MLHWTEHMLDNQSRKQRKKVQHLSKNLVMLQPSMPKEALVGSLEPVLAVLKQRFSKLKLHGNYVCVHDAAPDEEIQ